jgi:hypothetical protein
MSKYLDRHELDNQPLHLSDEEIKQPYKVLEDFCGDFNLGEIRKLLFEGLQVSVAGENDMYRVLQKRIRAFDWYMRAQIVLEAVFAIIDQKLTVGPEIVSSKNV